jgi:hypothetical protein
MDAQDFLKFAVNTLQADPSYQDKDMSTTSPLYNMTILPFAIMGKPVQDAVDNVFNQLKLVNMTESQLDDFATMYFVVRRSNSLSSVDITIYFTLTPSVTDPVIVYSTDEFKTLNGEVFYPVQDYVFAYNTLPLDSTAQYKIANITASSNTVQNQIQSDSIVSTSFVHPNFSHVANSGSSSIPVNSETNEEFIKDLQNSTSDRTLSTNPGILVNLKDAFNYLTDIMPVGYGDPEMQRDIAVAAKSWSGHFSGNIDIYAKSDIAPCTFSTVANRVSDGYQFLMRKYKGYDWMATDSASPYPQSLTPWIQITGSALPALPVVSIDWDASSITNTTFSKATTGLYDYTIEVMPDPESGSAYGKNYRYSIYEYLRITIKTATQVNASETITLKYDSMFGSEDIQSYLNANCDLCTSTLLRSYIPVVITDLNISYKSGYAVDETTWATTLANIINTWNTNEPINLIALLAGFPAPLKINEIWKNEEATLPSALDAYGSITGTQTPSGMPSCYAAMLLDNIDGSRSYYLSTQQISPIVKTGLSASPRTCRYFIKASKIKFTKGSW